MRSKQNKLKRKVSRHQRAGAPKIDFDSELKVVNDKLEEIKSALGMIMKQSKTWTVSMVEQLRAANSCIDDIHSFLESLLDVIIGPRTSPYNYRPRVYMLLHNLNQSDFLKSELEDEITKVKGKLVNIKTALDVRFDDKSLLNKCANAQLYIDEIYTSLLEVIHYFKNGFRSNGNRIDILALGKYQNQQIENAAHLERLRAIYADLYPNIELGESL